MTSLEAHEYLEDFQRIMTRPRQAYSEDLIEANGQAILALEKQIPKKPTPHKVEVDKIKIGNANWCKGTTVYKCPCCNELISRIYAYCYKCGQALDWSDTE